jgi:hypothetical protein
MSPSQRNRTAGSHALSDEKDVAGYAFGSIIRARTTRRMSQSSNTSHLWMWPPGAAAPYDHTASWMSSGLPPPSDSLAGLKRYQLYDAPYDHTASRMSSGLPPPYDHTASWMNSGLPPPYDHTASWMSSGLPPPYDHTASWMSPGLPPPSDSLAGLKRYQLYDAPVPRDDASFLCSPSVRSQSVNKRSTTKFDDQEIMHSYSRPGQPQSPVTHEHRQAIYGSILIPDGYPLNQISTGGNGGETPQHHDPSNLVWKSPSKPLLQGVGDVLDSDSDEADESGSYYSAVDEPEMHMPVMVPQTSGQLDLFWKQHEHNSLNSNVNPINFVIKKMLKARRIAHRTSVRTFSTLEPSIKLDTNSFISYSSE